MMTAYASVDLAVEAMKLGATDFVRKPMTPEILRNALAAALAKTPELPRSVATDDKHYIFPQVTLNGFTVLPSRSALQPTTECRFIVRGPDGREQEVVVEIDPEAVLVVERLTNDLPLGSAFWIEQAGQFLSDFIWNDGNAPASGRLTLKGVEREAVEKAMRKEVRK
jgi:hypothetical protein